MNIKNVLRIYLRNKTRFCFQLCFILFYRGIYFTVFPSHYDKFHLQI